MDNSEESIVEDEIICQDCKRPVSECACDAMYEEYRERERGI